MLIQSGIAPLDDQVGGLMPGRPYVISGSPGTGKSVSCLEFLDVALERGEPAALLTHDDPSDVLSSGAFLGMDLQRALRDERLVLIRYQLNFIKLFSRTPSADAVFAELRRLLGSRQPVRLAIDSIVPFLEGGASSGSASMFALIQFIDQLETTSLLTYPGDLAGLYDKRLEPIMQRAAGVFHLSNHSQARRHGLLEVRKLRYQAKSLGSIPFRIQAGAGFVVVHEAGSPPAEEIQRKLLVLNLADPFPEELLRILERDHSVVVRTGVASAFSDLVRSGLGALLLNVRRDVVADALQLVRELRRAENAVPIVMVTPYVLRSSDRTRALRAGADDFLSTNLPPDEFIARVASIAQRGRSENAPTAEPEPPIFLQPSRDGESYYLLDAAGFRNAIGLHLARERAPFFTVIRAEPVSGDVMTLADLALRMSRLDSGDLVGFEGRSVLLYLDGARPKELKAYLGRLNDEWRRIAGDEMAVETFGFPADESQIRSFARVAPAP
jgi:KaiC/GvpD/RAD55 family RecA-like ATPase/DNA-binding response OmpR family regulator